MLILLAVTLVLLLPGFTLIARLRPRAGPARAGGPEAPGPALSIIIPARNEAHNLPALLDSIRRQPGPPSEVLVVDDGSTDATAAIARSHGARVLASAPLPDGWRGKTWACHQGAEAASGELLLFLDADTVLEPGGLARLLAVRESGAFSAGPYHAVRRPYEQLSLFFNLAMVAGTIPHGLFGQMLLVDRRSYREAGGHAAVKERILENAHLAAAFCAARKPVRSIPGRGSLRFRMYPGGLRELVEGWTKGFASGAGRTPGPVLALIVGWMVGLMLVPTGWLVFGPASVWGAVYLFAAAQVFGAARLVGTFHPAAALLYPVPLLFFFALFAWSASRSGRQVRWKGRDIRAD